MSIVNSFSAGSTIESSAMNANFTDIASEVTNSLPRDGQAAMTGQLKAASGTSALPSITFGADTDTGFYRKGANTIGIVAGGTEVGTIGAGGFSSFESGTVLAGFVQTAAPTGWTKSTTHNNKALRVVSGSVSTGGSTSFSEVFAARTINEINLPAHFHTFSATTSGQSQTHNHGYNDKTNPGTAGTTGGGLIGDVVTDDARTTGNASQDHTHTVSGNTSLTGSGIALDFSVQYVDIIICTKD